MWPIQSWNERIAWTGGKETDAKFLSAIRKIATAGSVSHQTSVVTVEDTTNLEWLVEIFHWTDSAKAHFLHSSSWRLSSLYWSSRLIVTIVQRRKVINATTEWQLMSWHLYIASDFSTSLHRIFLHHSQLESAASLLYPTTFITWQRTTAMN